MPTHTLIDKVVTDINAEKAILTKQLQQLDAALLNLEGFSTAVRDKVADVGGSPLVVMRKFSRLSAAARRKISIAQKARWAKVRSVSTERGQMSAAARRKISLAQKARWVKVKSGQK